MNRCQCFHIPQRWAPYCILATTSRTCRRENTGEQTTGISLMSYTLEKCERRKGAKECKYRINSALYHYFYWNFDTIDMSGTLLSLHRTVVVTRNVLYSTRNRTFSLPSSTFKASVSVEVQTAFHIFGVTRKIHFLLNTSVGQP